MTLLDLTVALDAIDVTTRMTALHISEEVAFKTAQFTMDALVRYSKSFSPSFLCQFLLKVGGDWRDDLTCTC